MKIIKALFIFVPSFFALVLSSVNAAELSSNISGKEKIGTVSAGNAYSVDDLARKLSKQADAQGASAMKIIAAGGSNKLQGVAEIYR